MKMQVVSLVLLFSLQNNFLMSMQQQGPSAPPAVDRRLMEAQVNDSYYAGYNTYMVQGNSNTVVGTVSPLHNEDGLVIAASSKGFERQNLGHNSANVAYFFDKVTGLFSRIGTPQEGQAYEFKKTQLVPISRENSAQTIIRALGNVISANPVLDVMAQCATFSTVGSFVFMLGTSPQRLHYLGANIAACLLAALVGKQARVCGQQFDQQKYHDTYGNTAMYGALMGVVGVIIKSIG
jgi:hypothetical protein